MVTIEKILIEWMNEMGRWLNEDRLQSNSMSHRFFQKNNNRESNEEPEGSPSAVRKLTCPAISFACRTKIK